MKNLLSTMLIGAIFLTSVLGCGLFGSGRSDSPQPVKDKTTTDKVVDKTVGTSKIGVPECDEVIESIETELNNSEDDFVTKAVKATVLNRIKDGIRESVEKNTNDKEELAKTCREFKTQFERYRVEEQNKKTE